MIEWQGRSPLAEMLGPVLRVYVRCLTYGLLMLAFVSVANIMSWVIWKGDASVLLYPMFVVWICFYMMILQTIFTPHLSPEYGGKAAIVGMAIANAPVAVLTTMMLNTPVLYGQVAVAKLISSVFR